MKSRLIFVFISFVSFFCQGQLLWHNPDLAPNFITKMEYDNSKSVFSTSGGYYIVKVGQIFSQNEKSVLVKDGITIIEYLPNLHYLVSVRNLTNLVEIPQVISIAEFKPQHKLEKSIYYGDACSSSNGKSTYLVQWMSDQDLLLDTESTKYKDKIISISKTERILKMSLRFSEVELLTKERWVKFIQCLPEDGPADDKEGRSLHRVNLIGNNKKENLSYDGTGVRVCVRDDGFVGPHVDFKNRIIQDVYNDNGNHGDMVSGILCGAANIDPNIQGMAPKAELYVLNYQADFLDKTMELHQREGVVITNSSYSDGCNGGYTLGTQIVDNQIFENPTLIHVFSAGNANGSDCGYGAGNQWGNITGGHKIAKNCLTVANVMLNGMIDPTSSRGPTKDGRMKPEVSARGNSQLSTNSNNTYQVGGGTSAASPSTAGTAALLYQVYKEKNNNQNPPSALIKACLMNTATDIGTAGPDYIYGYGIIDAYSAYKLIAEKRYQSFSITNGEKKVININIPAGKVVSKIMLYYTEQAASALSPKGLINDVDLTVKSPNGQMNLPLVLDPSPSIVGLSAGAKLGVERNNNFEQVVLSSPVAGDYQIEINGTSVPDNSVDCFVLIEHQDQVLKLTSPIGGEKYQSPENTLIYFTTHDLTTPVSAKLSLNGGATWSVLNAPPLGNRLFNWAIPIDINSDSCMIEITQGGRTDRSELFTITKVVPNIRVTKFCPDGLELTWDGLDKDSFLIYGLGNFEMEPYITTTQNTIQIDVQTMLNKKWFAVAGFKNGILSQRGKAVSTPDSLFKCPQNKDLGIVVLEKDNNLLSTFGCDDAQIFPNIRVHNRTLYDAEGFTVNVNVGNTSMSQYFNSKVKAYDSTIVKFTNGITLSTIGKNKVKVFIEFSGDTNPLNDTTYFDAEFFQLKDRNPVFPMVEGFDQNLPNDWTYVNSIPNSEIEFRKVVDKKKLQNQSLYFMNTSTNFVNIPFYIVSKSIDLTTAINPYFYFDHAYNMENSGVSVQDTMIIKVKELCNSKGLERTLFYFGGSQLATAKLDTNKAWTPLNDSVWYAHEYSLSEFKGKKIVLEFQIKRGYLGTLLMDNIEVKEKESTSQTARMVVNPLSPCVNKIVTIKDSSNFKARSINWDFGVGATPRSATGVGPFSIRYLNTSGVKNILAKIETEAKDYFLVETLDVLGNPLSAFNYSNTTNGNVVFTNNSRFGLSYLWEFGDGETSTEVAPTHQYKTTGIFKSKLTTTNQCGINVALKDINVTTVSIDPVEDLSIEIFPIPANDYIQVKSNDSGREYKIFNSEGKLVKAGIVSQNDKIDIKNLMSGFYKLQLAHSSSSKYVTKQFEVLK